MPKKKDNKPDLMGTLKKFDEVLQEMAQTRVGKLMLGDPDKNLTEAAVPSPKQHANTIKNTIKAVDRVDDLERQAFRKRQKLMERVDADMAEAKRRADAVLKRYKGD